MEDAIRRSVERQFPELTGAYHLPRFGRVVGIPDAPAGHTLSDTFRPRYCVDVQVLTPDGEPDPDLPTLFALPLPVPQGGNERGLYGFPESGTTVVIGFAYGLPHKPYIQQILSHGLSLPKLPNGDQVWQHNEDSQQRVDADGNWLRSSAGRIRDQSIERAVHALDNTETFQTSNVTVDEHSTESIGGVKTIEALGALKLLSAGNASLIALDDLNQASGRDHNLVVAKDNNVLVGGDAREQIQGQLQEQIEGLRKSISAGGQHLEAPTTWLGSDSVNVLQVLLDLVDLVQQMNTQLAGHGHSSLNAPPSTAANFTANVATAQQLNGQLAPITA